MWNELRNPYAAFSNPGLLRSVFCAVFVCVTLAADAKPRNQKQITSATPVNKESDKPKQEPSPDQNRSEKPTQDEKKEKAYVVESRITLGDGRIVNGRLKFNAPEKITLVHEAEGIQYEKVIGIGEISSIEILKWKGKFLRENKNGMVYEFAAEEFRIRLKDAHELRKSGGLFPFLRKIPLENKNGQIQVFTFWMDLKKPDGTWYTGIAGPDTGLRNTCHPDVIRRIDFEK